MYKFEALLKFNGNRSPTTRPLSGSQSIYESDCDHRAPDHWNIKILSYFFHLRKYAYKIE